MSAHLLVLALTAASPTRTGAAPTLSPADQAAIMKVACTGELDRDAEGWLCRQPAAEEGAEPSEQRWVKAWRGRFVTQADEWLVSLAAPCIGGICPGSGTVMRKVRGRWRSAHAIDIDRPLGEECIQVGGMADGRDRLVCLEGYGPHQGFMTERVAVLSFAGGELATSVLAQKDQGGECFLSPPADEYQEDLLTLEAAQPAQPETAFTARLQVRRAPCAPETDEGHGPLSNRSEHVLRFLRRGNEVVPDAGTARVLAAQDWLPPAP